MYVILYIDLELIGSRLWLKVYILCEVFIIHDVCLTGDNSDGE